MELQDFLNYQRVKENLYSGIKENDILYLRPSISSGINWLDPPSIYNELVINEMKKNHFIKNYSSNNGYLVLLDAIKQYEYYKFNASLNESNLPSNLDICITPGATASISLLFNYFYTRKSSLQFLILGLSYYMFYFCLERLNFNYYTLISQLGGRIYPTIDEIENYLFDLDKKIDYVILTAPLNPSGELYNRTEFNYLIKILKKHNIKLIIDICQMDEFNDIGEYVNFNFISRCNYYESNLIIINSFSKTRSIPGARIGYIVAQRNIIEYISSQNEYYYSNHPLIYITPIITDMMFRIHKLSIINDRKISIRKISNSFRKNIISRLGLTLYHEIFKIVFIDMDEKYNKFSLEIKYQHEIFEYNKNYILSKLNRYIDENTELQGGFNFCIKLKNTSKNDQLTFSELICKNIDSLILPEYAFNGYCIDKSNEPFWIRITVALDTTIFTSIVDRFESFLNRLN